MLFKSYEGKVLEATIVGICAMLVLLLAFIFISIYAPPIESKLLPVVTNFNISNIEPLSDKEVLLRGTFNRIRPECKLYNLVAYTSDKTGTLKAPVKLDLLGIASNNMTVRIAGKQSWGPWKVSSEQPLNRTVLTLTSYHDCHGLYLIPTTLISIPLSISEPYVMQSLSD